MDPNAPSENDELFGLEPHPEKDKIHLIPVPWDATTSYGSGSSKGPAAIKQASQQLDLLDRELGNVFENGIYLHELNREIELLNQATRKLVEEFRETKSGTTTSAVNSNCEQMNEFVYQQTRNALDDGKLVGLIGGDHSTPYGFIKSLSEKYEEYGILHIDAHMDLRLSYEGFKHSHASIMREVMGLENPPHRLIQVGIRDYCEEEESFGRVNGTAIKTYFDFDTKQRLSRGESWYNICSEIVEKLPKNVYISFDIDGLDPQFCPNTGTPVPGGLSYDQAIQLFSRLSQSHKIIGFDLVEVAPSSDPENEWDGNVGMRLLYKLCGWLAKTNR